MNIRTLETLSRKYALYVLRYNIAKFQPNQVSWNNVFLNDIELFQTELWQIDGFISLINCIDA